jgi:hypothetical protein
MAVFLDTILWVLLVTDISEEPAVYEVCVRREKQKAVGPAETILRI